MSFKEPPVGVPVPHRSLSQAVVMYGDGTPAGGFLLWGSGMRDLSDICVELCNEIHARSEALAEKKNTWDQTTWILDEVYRLAKAVAIISNPNTNDDASPRP